MLFESRDRIGLNLGWRFRLGACSPRRFDRVWGHGEAVDLPHSWNARDGFQPGVDYYLGTGTYLRTVRVPEGMTHLVAGGFYGLAEVYLDRRRIARVDGQYLGFRLDLAPHVVVGKEHELALRLTNRCPRSVLPGTRLPDFLLHGGLAGGLNLESRPEDHLDEDGIVVRAGDLSAPTAKLAIRVPIVAARPAGLHLGIRLVDDSGEGVAESAPMAVPPGGVVETELRIDRPRLWSPEEPRRYRLEIDLERDGGLVERCRLAIGLRTAEFSAAGLRLNGQPYRLRGFNRHESIPGLGNALSPSLHRADAELLKEHGANAVRLSHYPQSPDFLDACDELGLFVYAEVASWKTARGGSWRRAALRQLEALVRRDRNRPSVLFWGMGNEARHRRTYRDMARLVHELDPGRPATYAESHFYRGRRSRISGIPDVWSCNYDIDSLPEQQRASRSGAVLVSECCNDQAERGDLEREMAQAAAQLDLWSRIENEPYVVGHLLWCFSDYGTMFRRRYTRFTGRFDAWRVPKVGAALFRARYSSDPVLEIFGSWALERGPRRTLAIVTNCQRIEIVSPEGAGELPQDGLLEVHQLDFAGEPLRLIGRHPRGEVSRTLRPWGRGRRLRIVPERKRVTWEWTGFDLLVLDDEEVPVRDFAGQARVEVSGGAALGTLRPDGGLDLARGQGRFYLRSGSGAGTAHVAAFADGLEGARLTLELDPRRPVPELGADGGVLSGLPPVRDA